MLDFTSSLYLGFTHATADLPPWHQLTTGRPAILGRLPGEPQVARKLAALVGTDSATLGVSTLHLLWDWFGMLDPARDVVYYDSRIYPTVRWGIERARSRGVRCTRFRHGSVADAARRIRHQVARDVRPTLAVCGTCLCCGRLAPLRKLLHLTRQHGGRLLVDDTQALGILGAAPTPQEPYGRGGGGTARWKGVAGPELVLALSLAKGFGVPLAVLAASREPIRDFESAAETRIHASPPSTVAVLAAQEALARNQREGDRLRQRLLHNVGDFRHLAEINALEIIGGWLPFQTLLLRHPDEAHELHHRLASAGIATVLPAPRDDGVGRLVILLTARHQTRDVARLFQAIRACLSRRRSTFSLSRDILP